MTAWLRPPSPLAAGMRIGLLGGSFNPAHEGHLYVSETALKQLDLDCVWWLVSPQNPLKPAGGMAPLAQRLETARRIVGGHPRILVSDLERNLGTRYSFDTVRALQRRFPHIEFVWLMGSDNLATFRKWRRWADMARCLPIAVVLRPGSVFSAFAMRTLEPLKRVRILDGRRNSVSASAIRAGLVARRPA